MENPFGHGHLGSFLDQGCLGSFLDQGRLGPAPQKYDGYVPDECTTKAKDENGNDYTYLYKCDGGGEEPYIYRQGWTGNPQPGEIFFTTCDDPSYYDAASKQCVVQSNDCPALQTAYKNNCACIE